MSTPIVSQRKVEHGRTRTVLRALGIPIKIACSFWQANLDQLPYLYRDFQVKARQVKRELHPDTPQTGNAAEFRKFSAACDLVERQFRIRGIGEQPNAVAREAEAAGRIARRRARRCAGRFARKHA